MLEGAEEMSKSISRLVDEKYETTLQLFNYPKKYDCIAGVSVLCYLGYADVIKEVERMIKYLKNPGFVILMEPICSWTEGRGERWQSISG